MNRKVVLPGRTVTPPEIDGALAGGLLASGGIVIAAMVVASLLLDWSPSPLTWYIARASGLVLYLITWLTMLLGLGLTTRLANGPLGRGLAASLHAYAFHLWYGFLTLHMLSLAIDPTQEFGARELLVPFASDVRQPWTGLGVLAAELTVVLGASFAVRRVAGFRAWRALHWLAFPVFAIGLAHGVGAGTDSDNPGMLLLYLVTAGTVVFATTYRLLTTGNRQVSRGAAPASPRPRDRFGQAAPATGRHKAGATADAAMEPSRSVR
jgi:methionine sulfoxide reductase heme-binding subunit